MKSEELAVIIFEECSSKTRSTKECVEAIKLRTGFGADFEDTIRRYRQAGSGLEKAAQEVLVAVTSGWSSVDTSHDSSEVKATSNYDTYLSTFKQRDFSDAETCAKLAMILEKKGIAFDPHTVEEVEEDNYSCGNFGLKVGESLYVLDSVQRIADYAIESRAESIRDNAWDLATDEVNDMDTEYLLEYGGYYDGVKSYDTTDDHDEILIELNA